MSQPHTPDRPRVLITTASVGAGHRSVAEALTEALRIAAGGQIDVDCLDVLDFTPRVFRMYYAGGFALGMSRWPRLYGLGYRLMNHPNRPGVGLTERPRLLSERFWLRRFTRRLGQMPPTLLVHTHFLPTPAVGRLIRTGRLPTRQMVLLTDICVHRFWHSQTVEHWFAPFDESAEALRRWGIGEDRITISGIPVHAKWTAPLDRRTILEAWKLPAQRPIVTLSGGTEFTCGPVSGIARSLLEACPGMHLIVLVGRNEDLRKGLSAFPDAGGRMSVVPFTDRVHELLEVSSLMVTKPGGVTIAECLAKGRAMVLLKPVPGHEAGNASYLARHGAAVMAESHQALAGRVARLLADPDALARMSAAARGLYKPATQIVVTSVLNWLRGASASARA